MFGREVLLPLNLVIGQAEPSGGSSKTEYAAKLSGQMERIHQFACNTWKWVVIARRRTMTTAQ